MERFKKKLNNYLRNFGFVDQDINKKIQSGEKTWRKIKLFAFKIFQFSFINDKKKMHLTNFQEMKAENSTNNQRNVNE